MVDNDEVELSDSSRQEDDKAGRWTNFKAMFGVLRQIDAKGRDTYASPVELRKTVLEERRSEKYDALLAGIGDAFHAIACDLRQEGPSRVEAPTDPSASSSFAASSSRAAFSSLAAQSEVPTDPSASSSLAQQLLVLSMDRTVRNVRELWVEYIVGRNGRLPVRAMNQRSGFRTNERASKRGISESEAAGLVEAFRIEKGYELNKLSEWIREHIRKGISQSHIQRPRR
ncbi:uncharacterized protein IAS62_002423 [Cryptococcus decagattii]|uniref:Transcription activator GCR1-like domain-containing protein n=1 Tax=Cryptococcus decagattii TaxID=1859122 RepID=A0ABZ2ATB1_9TREE